MRRSLLLGSAAATLPVAGAIVATLVVAGGPPSPPVPAAGIGAVASVSPRTALFGDEVEASIVAVVDRGRVRVGSLDLRGSFAPYVPVAQVVETRDDVGSVSRIRLRVALRCVEPACLPPDPARGGGEESVRLPAARLGFVRADGRAGSLAVRWPPFDVASRLPEAVAAAANPAKQPDFRASLALPRVTWAISPVLLEWLLVAGGALLLAVSAALAAVVARPALLSGRALVRRRRREPAGLERALLLLRRAQARGSVEERRKALELLALELRLSGEGDLAEPARTLAWSEPPPTSDDTDGLAAAVQQRLRGEANGNAAR